MARWFRRSRSGAGGVRHATREDSRHLAEFARTRRGVEAFVEPRTAVTETTMVLVASDGEWTRRRVDGPQAAWDFARDAGIPVYDAAIVGYPQRMREWTAAQRPAASDAERPAAPDA